MQVDRFAIGGPLLLTPRLFADERGFFQESWNQRSFAEALGVPVEQAPVFHQDNHSRSSRGVLRGLHYQLPPEPQAKLVRCVSGAIFDVAVDLRRSSPSYGQWVGHEFVPRGEPVAALAQAIALFNAGAEAGVRNV